MTTTDNYTAACPELPRRDAVGNRLSTVNDSGWSYDSSNHLTGRPGVSYTYDNNGNTATKVDSNGTTTYAWDYIDRLASVTLPGTGGTVTFKYDPFGRRAQKVSPAGTTNYLYDGANSIEELDATGTVLARYAQGPGIDQPLDEFTSGATKYFDADGLGSITSLADISGSLTDTYTTDTFGKTTASSGTTRNPYRYTARELDSETGLMYYRARYYDPAIGRFISEDPIRFVGGENFYAYVENDPINSVDPLGLAQCLYEIGKHTLTCVSTNDPSNQIQIAGDSINSGASKCKNENRCESVPFLGPIPRGKYRMNKDPRPEHPTWYRLESIPPVRWWEYYTGLRRSGFALHLGTLSEGCINVDKTNPAAAQQYQQLLQLLDAEQGNNFLFVEQ